MSIPVTKLLQLHSTYRQCIYFRRNYVTLFATNCVDNIISVNVFPFTDITDNVSGKNTGSLLNVAYIIPGYIAVRHCRLVRNDVKIVNTVIEMRRDHHPVESLHVIARGRNSLRRHCHLATALRA